MKRWITACVFVLAVAVVAVGFLSRESHGEKAAHYGEAFHESLNSFETTRAALLEASQKMDQEIQEARSKTAEQPENPNGQELIDQYEAQWKHYADGIDRLDKELLTVEENFLKFCVELDKVANVMTDPVMRNAEWKLNEKMRAAFYVKNLEAVQTLHRLHRRKFRAYNARQSALLAQMRQERSADFFSALAAVNTEAQTFLTGLKSFTDEGLKIAKEGKKFVNGLAKSVS